MFHGKQLGIWTLCGASALLTFSRHAEATQCRPGEVESRGVCCPKGSWFENGDCVTSALKVSEPPASLTKITIVPALKIDGERTKRKVFVSVAGGPKQEAVRDAEDHYLPLTFEVDVRQPYARVDIQGDQIYDAHTYVPVGDGRAFMLDTSLTMFANLVVKISGAVPDDDINAHVYVDCPGAAQCSLAGKNDRTCAFAIATSQCAQVRVRIVGNVNAESKDPVRLATEDTTTITFDFERSKPSKVWLALPIGAALASIGLLVGSAVVKDEGVSYGLIASGTVLGAADLFGGSLLLGWVLAPPTHVNVHVERPKDAVPSDRCTLPGVLARRTAPGGSIGLSGFAVRW